MSELLTVRVNAVLGTLSSMHRDVNGFLHFEGHMAKPGVIDYADVGGPRELTTPEDLLDPQSVESLIGMPISDQHPPEQPQFITPQTAQFRTRGAIKTAWADGDALAIAGVIYDGDLAQKVEEKRQIELSAGMRCNPRQESGVWRDGERFNSVRGFALYNHVAVVPRGRCSDTCGTGPCGCRIRTNGGSMAAKQKGFVTRVNAEGEGSSDPAMDAALKCYPDDTAAALKMYKELQAWKNDGAVDDDDEADPMVPEMQAPAASPLPRMNARVAGGIAVELAQLKAERAADKAAIKALQKALEQESVVRTNAVAQAAGEHSDVLEQVRMLAGRDYRGAGKSAHAMRVDALAMINSSDAGYVEEIKGYNPEVAKGVFDQVMRSHPQVLAARANAAAGGYAGEGFTTTRANASEVDSLSEAELLANGRIPGQVVNGRLVRANS